MLAVDKGPGSNWQNKFKKE